MTDYRLITLSPAEEREGIADRYELDHGELILGRSIKTDLQLQNATISGRHARLVVGADGCWVIDLDSSNGTAVNGERITEATRLQPGDRLSLGGVTFLLEAEQVSPTPTSTPESPLDLAGISELETATVFDRTRSTPAGRVDDDQLAMIDAAPIEVRLPSTLIPLHEGIRRIEPRRIGVEAQERPTAPGPPEKETSRDYPPPPNRRNKVPTILQMEAVECGAAALAMIMASYGRWTPLEECRVQCGVSRDGSKASNLVKGARRYGMVARGFKYNDVKDLYDLEFPVILFWNFNHFVVLEGFSGGKAWINDPAQGPRSVSLEELDASFSGIVLTFEPGADFEPGGQGPNMVAALRRRLSGSEAALTFIVVCGLFLVIPGLVVPTFTRIFIDEILVAGRASLLRPLLIAMGLTALLMMALTRFQEYYLLRLESKLALSTSSSFFHHVLRLPVTYFAQRYAGEIGSRVMINDKVAQLLSGSLATTLLDCVLVVFYATLMFFYDFTMTVVGVGLSLLNVVALQFASRRRADASRRLLQEDGKLTGTAMNGLASIETLKATGGESEFFSRWAGYQAKALRAEQELSLVAQYTSAVPGLVQSLITAAVLLLGSFAVMNGEMSIGTLIAYQTLMASFTRPLGALVSFGSSLQELKGDMSRLDDVLNHPIDPQHQRALDQGEPSPSSIKLAGRVELDDITFGYNPVEAPLIEGFNLKIEPGQRVALVGPSGSGKSTISKLVAGLYEPWNGQILFDGAPRSELPRSLIANSLAAVDQEIFLFSGTVQENVTMWDSTIPVARMTRAAKDAAIDDVIETRDGAFQSEVDEGGDNFSGGQRQRLEIARALVSDPTILILDEATSALDPTTEKQIDDNLRRRGCTCLIVAHRLSTIRDCDEIIVMDRGKIVQRGTHDEMKSVEGIYASLIQE